MKLNREMSTAFGKVIKKYREKQGISLSRLAEMAGTAQTHPGKMEKNVVSPNLDSASAYAKALGISLSKLIAEAEKLQKNS
jgi:transcriptional regulator with XRE-family HTH domain